MAFNSYGHAFSNSPTNPDVLPTLPGPPQGSLPAVDFGQHLLRLVSDIQCEDIRRERESRTSMRQQLVIPVTIRFLNGERVVEAVSRNLSFGGIGLITRQPMPELASCLLQLYRENQPANEIVSECRWSKSFGNAYWISGWQFLRLPHDFE